MQRQYHRLLSAVNVVNVNSDAAVSCVYNDVTSLYRRVIVNQMKSV